jgi:hypothetical protein
MPQRGERPTLQTPSHAATPQANEAWLKDRASRLPAATARLAADAMREANPTLLRSRSTCALREQEPAPADPAAVEEVKRLVLAAISGIGERHLRCKRPVEPRERVRWPGFCGAGLQSSLGFGLHLAWGCGVGLVRSGKLTAALRCHQ